MDWTGRWTQRPPKEMPKHRHEVKFALTVTDLIDIRPRVQAVMRLDNYAQKAGKYLVRSLYFDNDKDSAFRAKLDGSFPKAVPAFNKKGIRDNSDDFNPREKFRIRCYQNCCGGEFETVKLEKKSKWNGLGAKSSYTLSETEVAQLKNGQLNWVTLAEKSESGSRKLVGELYLNMTYHGLRPRTIVEYTREPYMFDPGNAGVNPGNVRITFDYNLRTGVRCTELLNPRCPMVPVINTPIIMEVKWDEFLPTIVRNIIQSFPGTSATEFSKYAHCRLYD